MHDMHTPKCDFCPIKIPPKDMADHLKICRARREKFEKDRKDFDLETEEMEVALIDRVYSYGEFARKLKKKLIKNGHLPA